MATGPQMMLKALGIDPDQMVKDFEAFKQLAAQIGTALQEIKSEQRANAEANARMHSANRQAIEDIRADVQDMSSRFTALENAISEKGNTNAARQHNSINHAASITDDQSRSVDGPEPASGAGDGGNG